MRKQYQLREDLSDIAEMSDHEISINSGFIREVANEANCYMGYYHQAKETIHRQGKTAHRLKTRIKAQEEQLETVRNQLEQARQERDAWKLRAEAAERDMLGIVRHAEHGMCETCANRVTCTTDCHWYMDEDPFSGEKLPKCYYKDNDCPAEVYSPCEWCMQSLEPGSCLEPWERWEWRGPCAENGGTT